MMEGSGTVPDPYLLLTDPDADPKGPKKIRIPNGSGSATLADPEPIFFLDEGQKGDRQYRLILLEYGTDTYSTGTKSKTTLLEIRLKRSF